MEAFLCSDGLKRWPRLYEIPERRGRKKEEVPEKYQNFDNLFKKLSLQFRGEAIPFCRSEWSRKKFRLIQTVLENLKDHKVDLELYLLFLFESSKKHPKYLYPVKVASLKTVKEFQEWLTGFCSKKDARKQSQTLSLEEMLTKSHQKYLYYHQDLKWSDKAIFKNKGSEFDPLYLLGLPSFLDFYSQEPEALVSIRERIEQAKHSLERDAATAKDFWEVLGKITCQPYQTNSISYFSQRS